jgi:hypothetical protein
MATETNLSGKVSSGEPIPHGFCPREFTGTAERLALSQQFSEKIT